MRSAHAETLTEFLRKPNQVLKKVEKHDVVLKRTSGKPSIRLSLESRASASDAGSELAALLLADALAAAPEIMPDKLAAVLETRFPWVRLLPADDRLTFTREFVDTLAACVSVGTSARLHELIGDWKATASIHADPALVAALKRPLRGTSIPVPRPGPGSRGKKR
jgi:hypothetical protein